MLSDLHAYSNIRGERIDLSWRWTDPGSRPGLRLVRRRHAYPVEVTDGLTVIDLDDDFAGVSTSTVRIKRAFYLPLNTQIENGLPMAELALYFKDSEAEPYRARIGHYNVASDEYLSVNLDTVSRIKQSETHPTPWRRVLTQKIFVMPDGAPEVLGQVVIYTGHVDGISPDRFEWVAADEPPVTVDFANKHVTVDFANKHEQSVTIVLDERFDRNSGDWHRGMSVQDAGLDPQVVYYYALYAKTESTVTPYRTQRDWHTAVMATGRHGLGEQLYRQLPSLHQYYDESEPAQQGQGQLRRFLSLFGAAADQARSLADGLKHRHAVHEVHADALPALARWIGWEPDLTADALTLRGDILQAPEIFRTMGTVPNLRALVNRVTGWDCKIKEFASSSFLSSAPETIRLWEIREGRWR